jgi:hypothetical protein
LRSRERGAANDRERTTNIKGFGLELIQADPVHSRE